MELKDFGRALHMMKNWNKVQRKWRNGLDKQDMYIDIQLPDDGSKMNMPYVYMHISWIKDGTQWDNLRPFMPSMYDLFSEDREVVE